MTAQFGYLDTNLFVHYLHPNDPHFSRCQDIIDALEDGSAQGWLDATVVYELTFILERRRRFPNRAAIAEYIRTIVTMSGVRMENETLLLAAVDRWSVYGVGFTDAWIFVQATADGQPVCTVNARDYRGLVNTF